MFLCRRIQEGKAEGKIKVGSLFYWYVGRKRNGKRRLGGKERTIGVVLDRFFGFFLEEEREGDFGVKE